MEDHIAEINKFCRFCKSNILVRSYKVSTYAEALNYIYKEDRIDVTKDDSRCQSKSMCQSCYRNAKKAEDAIKFKKKNPNSTKTFQFAMPPYNENVNVFRGEPEPVDQPMVGVTPSKVRKLSGEPVESPSDKLTVREQKQRTPARKSVKFNLEKYETNFETGDLDLSEQAVVKVFTSQDSLLMERVSNPEVAKFFSCRVCGKFPRVAKVSVTCAHIFCKVCIENYKKGVDSTKCPPAQAAAGDDEDLDRQEDCKIPVTINDIIEIAGLLKDIHESIKFPCSKAYCDKSFNIKELGDHEKTCKVRGVYDKEKRSLSTTRSEVLKKESSKTINLVLDWCKVYKISPCDFLFFALKRLISTEAPELEESVQHVFKIYLKEADLDTEGLTATEGLALKIDTDQSNTQYQKLRMNKVFGTKLPSLARVTKEKQKLDPGNVTYKVFNRTNGELLEIHEAKPNSGIIDVDEDLTNFSYGDLNINVSGCRATLHDSIAKFMEEKYYEIEEEIKKHPDSKDILSDANRQMKVFAKVCFDGTSAPMKSSKGASRMAATNWLRGTFGIVGVEIIYHSEKDDGVQHVLGDANVENAARQAAIDQEEAIDDAILEVGEAVSGTAVDVREHEGAGMGAGPADFTIDDVSRMNLTTLSMLLDMLPEDLSNMSIQDIVSKSSTK